MDKAAYPLGTGKMSTGTIYISAFKVYFKTFWQSCLANVVALPVYFAALFTISVIRSPDFLRRTMEEFVEQPKGIVPYLRLFVLVLLLCAFLELIYSCVIARLHAWYLFKGEVDLGKALMGMFFRLVQILWTFFVVGSLLIVLWSLTAVAAGISAAALGVHMFAEADAAVSVSDSMPIVLLAIGLVGITGFMAMLVTQVFMLIPAVAASERRCGFSAVGRAFSLVGGSFWRVSGIFFFWNVIWVAGAAALFVHGSGALSVIAAVGKGEMFGGILFEFAPVAAATMLICHVFSVFMNPLYSALVNMVYFDLRVRKGEITPEPRLKALQYIEK